jgi:hypothetical protein
MELHRIAAEAIDTRFPAIKESQPEVLARHWTDAGEIEPDIGACIFIAIDCGPRWDALESMLFHRCVGT